VAAAKSDKSARTDPLELALADINKQFGTGSVMQYGNAPIEPVEAIPTGSIGLDLALGCGGLPRGRCVEVYGPESAGKTTVALGVIAQAQRLGGRAAFIDAEHALSLEYAASLGVDVPSLVISQPDSGEQALTIAEKLARSGALSIIVVDSVAALVPQAELEGEMGDAHVGLQARLMSQALRKLTGILATTGTCCVFINQLREKVGVFFGPSEVTTGGKALKFYSSVRLDVRRIETLKEAAHEVGPKDAPAAVGSRLRVKVAKNKVGPPFRTAEFDLRFGHGIDREGELIDLGLRLAGGVTKSGAWYAYAGQQLGNGKAAATAWLREHPAEAAALEAQIRQAVPALPVPEPAPSVPQPAVLPKLVDEPAFI
jgi:recombination protein RecA